MLVIAVSVRLAKSAVTKWYGDEADDSPYASRMLTKFGELHTRGGLSDEEFRTIKTKLASRLQADMGMPTEELKAGDRVEREEGESGAGVDSSADDGAGGARL